MFHFHSEIQLMVEIHLLQEEFSFQVDKVRQVLNRPIIFFIIRLNLYCQEIVFRTFHVSIKIGIQIQLETQIMTDFLLEMIISVHNKCFIG